MGGYSSARTTLSRRREVATSVTCQISSSPPSSCPTSLKTERAVCKTQEWRRRLWDRWRRQQLYSQLGYIPTKRLQSPPWACPATRTCTTRTTRAPSDLPGPSLRSSKGALDLDGRADADADASPHLLQLHLVLSLYLAARHLVHPVASQYRCGHRCIRLPTKPSTPSDRFHGYRKEGSRLLNEHGAAARQSKSSRRVRARWNT